MMRFQQVKTIARAEARLTRRLARYWIFLSLSYLIALIAYFYYSFLHGFFSSYSATAGLMAPRFFMGIMGMYYLIIYIVGTVFLAFDIRSRDMRERMSEVLDSRLYTNLELVIGRFLGILIPSWIPILVMAILLELIGLLLVALGSPLGEPIGAVSLLVFVFPMALPALAFALSLGFLVTLLVRNRLVAAVLLLSLLGIDFWALIKLPLTSGGLLDFIGFSSLSLPSEIIPGPTNLEIWLQRLAVLLVAFGMLWLSASVHPRLDGGSRAKLSFCGAGALILALALTGFGFYKNASDIQIASIWKEAHAARADVPVPDLLSISGEVRINPGKALNLYLDLTFRAPDQVSLKEALFTLNPGQEVKEVLGASGQPLPFTHEHGLLELTLPNPLGPGEETKVHLSIEGLPDDRFAFLESAITPGPMKAFGEGKLFLLGHKPALFDKRFVALMPGIRWLPASGPERGRDDPRSRPVDFFTVDLTVDLPNGWLAAGPGRRHKVEGDGDGVRFRFSPGAPVPEVALIASRFESRSVEIEGVLMEVLVHRNHIKNIELLAETGEKIRTWIGERLREAKGYGLSYPYDGLTLVEVPATFRSYGGGWRMGTAMAPPGLLLMRETGFPTARFDTAFRNPEAFKDREGGLVQAKWDRVRTLFKNDFSGGNILTGATRNLFTYQTAARGPEGLALNFMLENLSTLLITETRDYFSIHLFKAADQLAQVRESLMNSYFITRSFGNSVADMRVGILTAVSRPGVWKQAVRIALKELDPWDDPALTVDALNLKGNGIADILLDRLGKEKTGQLLSSLRETHKGRSFTFEDMVASGKAPGQDIEAILSEWLGGTSLPGFICSDAEIYRLPDAADGSSRYQLLFTVRNDEPASGVFRFVFTYDHKIERRVSESGRGETVLMTMGEISRSEPIQLAGKSAVRFGTVVSRPPETVSLSPCFSLNRSDFSIELPAVDQGRIEKVEAIEGLEDLPWVLPKEPYIIVDDLDDGFEIMAGEQSRGLRLNAREDQSDMTDQGFPANIVRISLLPDWTRYNMPNSWGKYRRTAVNVAAGKGDKKVAFTTSLPHAGQWDLDVYIGRSLFPVENYGTWNLAIRDGNGDEHEIKFNANAVAGGWNPADSLELPEGETSVIFSNKTDGMSVVADAIRWSPAAGN